MNMSDKTINIPSLGVKLKHAFKMHVDFDLYYQKYD